MVGSHYGAFARFYIIFVYGAYVHAADVISEFRKPTNIMTKAITAWIVELVLGIHMGSCVPGNDLPG